MDESSSRAGVGDQIQILARAFPDDVLVAVYRLQVAVGQVETGAQRVVAAGVAEG